MAILYQIFTLPECRLLDARDFGRVQLRERKAFPSKIFQRRTAEVKFLVVDDEKAIVELFVVANGQLRVLLHAEWYMQILHTPLFYPIHLL